MTYKIILDSSCNLRNLDGIDSAVVPLKIGTDEREFVDDAALDTTAMMEYLESYKGRSGTSCPNVGEFLDAFGDAGRIFVITITSNLSGCYNAAVQAKQVYEQTHPDRKVCTLDTLSTAGEMILIAEKLQELIGAGMEFEQIEKNIREYMQHTHLLFSLESLNNLARNGRVSNLVAKAVGLLGIRVVGKASDVGTLEAMHKVRGNSKALKTLMNLLTEMGYKGGRLHIDHALNESTAGELAQMIQSVWPGSRVTVGQCTGLCCFYAERGGVLIGFED